MFSCVHMKKKRAKKLLQDVAASYDVIAADYDRDRKRAWPIGRAVGPLLREYVQPNHHILDIGGGSGQLLPLLGDLELPLRYSGCDISSEVTSLAKSNFGSQYRQISLSWQVADMAELPYKKEDFDVVCALAVLHHVPSKELRLQAMREAVRVLRPGGVLIMANWCLDTKQAENRFNLKPQRVFNRLKGYDKGDYLIRWKGSSHTVQTNRYYHSFAEKELTNLVKASGFFIISNKSVALTTCVKSPAVSWITVARKPIEKTPKK